MQVLEDWKILAEFFFFLTEVGRSCIFLHSFCPGQQSWHILRALHWDAMGCHCAGKQFNDYLLLVEFIDLFHLVPTWYCLTLLGSSWANVGHPNWVIGDAGDGGNAPARLQADNATGLRVKEKQFRTPQAEGPRKAISLPRKTVSIVQEPA